MIAAEPKFCSRCHKIYDATKPDYTNYEVVKHIVYADERSPRKQPVDLCPDCKDALIRFMNSGR